MLALQLLQWHRQDQLCQDYNPSTDLAIDLKEEMSIETLVSSVWKRVQKPFIAHLERLPVKTTTELPQRLVIRAKHDERIGGTPVAAMDLTSAASRHTTLVGISDDEEGITDQQVYRDGELVSSSRV